MSLSMDLIDQFVDATNDAKSRSQESKETTVYGTVVKDGEKLYVQLDGSTVNTPVTTTTNVENGQRVSVLIKNHTATITGNLTDPSAGSAQVNAANQKITEFDIAIGQKLSVGEFTANVGYVKDLLADNMTVENILAVKADIEELLAGTITADELEAKHAHIDSLDAGWASLVTADIGKAMIKDLNASYAYIHSLEAGFGSFIQLNTDEFAARDAVIDNLAVNKLDATAADIKYANVEFGNITEAAIRKLFAGTGLIDNLVVGDGMRVSGELVAVTIDGSRINAGTLTADRLMLKDSESGLYYQLNVNALGEAYVTSLSEEEQKELQNGIHGENIIANSITAKHIVADDLTAFGATIANFKIVPASGVNLLTDETSENEVETSADSARLLSISNPDMIVSNGTYTLSFNCDSDDETIAWRLDATVYDKDDNGAPYELITKFERQKDGRWVGTGKCPTLSVTSRYDDITDSLTVEQDAYYSKTLAKVEQAGMACTNLVPVKAGDKFKITSTYGYYLVLVAEFDITQTMISHKGQADGTAVAVTDYEYTVPSGVSYIAINNRYQASSPMIVKKEIIEKETLGSDLQLRLLSEDPSKTVTTSKVKLELGTQATSWETAPGKLYSDDKSSPENDTRGIYMDTDGQFAVGNSNNYMKFYNDGESYKLALKTSRIELDSGKTVEQAVAESATDVQTKLQAIGKNLFLNSGRLQNAQISLEGDYDGVIIGPDATAPSGNALSCVWDNYQNHVEFGLRLPYQNYNNKIKAGDIVTVSMYLKFNRNTKYMPTVVCDFIGTHKYLQQKTLATDWRRLVVTGTAARDTDVGSAESAMSHSIRITIFDDAEIQDGDKLYFSSPKIEFGDEATAWTWATESDDTDIYNVVNTLDIGKSVSDALESVEGEIDTANETIATIERLLKGEYDDNEVYIGYNKIRTLINNMTGTESTLYVTDGSDKNTKEVLITETSGQGIVYDFAKAVSDVLEGMKDDAKDAIELAGRIELKTDELGDAYILIAPAEEGCKLKLTAEDVEFINSSDNISAVLTSDESDSLQTDNITVDNELRHTYGGRNLLTQASSDAEVTTTGSHRALLIHDPGKLIAGKKYTLSFEGTLPTGTDTWCMRVRVLNSDGSDAKYIDFITSFKQIGKKWIGTGKYPELPDGYVYNQLRLYPWPYAATHSDGFITETFKLESGSKATEYSVAPEDSGTPSGSFVWEVRSNGNYGLSWKGD